MKLPWSKKSSPPPPVSPPPAPDFLFLALVKELPDGVIVYDQNFRVKLINAAAEKIIELSANDCVNLEVKPELISNPKYKVLVQIIFPTLAPAITRLSEREWPEVVDMSLDEAQLKLRITAIKINAAAGPLFIKVIQDRTREENILALKKEFLEVAAHQMRTPLTSLSWAFESLGKSLQDKPELKPVIEEGVSVTQRLLKTVNDLLNAARIEEGRFDYKLEPADIIKTVKDVVDQALPVASQLKIKIFFETTINSLIIPIDVERLSLAISNLLDNAIKYTPANGTISVSIDKVADKFLKISISDTGIGIPSQDLGKIFTKFFRASNVKKVQTEGSGLGLFIVRNIVKSHGGEISVESEIDRGTTFSITLPVNTFFIPQKENDF